MGVGSRSNMLVKGRLAIAGISRMDGLASGEPRGLNVRLISGRAVG